MITIATIANAILRLTTDGRILLSFKPPGFFTSTKYEKLRIAEADAIVTSEEEGLGDGATTTTRAMKGNTNENDEDEDSEEESESDAEETDDDDSAEDLVESKKKSGKFQMNTRVGGFFGLLQDDEEGEQDDKDDDEDEGDGSGEEDVDGPK